MPNAHLEKRELKSFPFSKGGYEYKYIVNNKNEYLILTEKDEEKFFLLLLEKDKEYLLKSDKITRPTNIKIVQDAMREFIEYNEIYIISSNIFSNKNHLVKRSKYLKDILFFKDLKYDKKIEIEIGFGSGRHLLYKAKNNPDKLFIGVEIHKPSIEQLLKQCKLQNITNILVVDYDARILLQNLSSNSIEKIYIHFPVPWDKKLHRRVMSSLFIEECIRVLKKNGRVELRTDSENYFNYSLNLFLDLKKCNFEVKKNMELEVSSKYEDRWKKMEKNIYDLILINHEISQELKSLELPKFDLDVDIENLEKKFTDLTIKKSDYFVHFEKLYTSVDKKYGVVKVTFGNYEKSEHKYILIEKSKVTFLPKEILPIKQNIASLKIIKEYLHE